MKRVGGLVGQGRSGPWDEAVRGGAGLHRCEVNA
jgi:hypothetical protein